MLIKDEATAARVAQGDAHAAYADRVNTATVAELARAVIMDDKDAAPNNALRQLGRSMTAPEFEAQILPRFGVPNLLCEAHPTNRGKRCMYQIRGGEKYLICVYEAVTIPEFSIVMGVEKWVPDPNYLGEGGKPAQRADLQGGAAPLSMERAADILNAKGVQGLAAELDSRARDAEPSHIGMKKIMVPGPERVRGWRTILVYMMNHGLVSPEQIRNVVGHADRASWAGHLGARPEALGEWLK